MPTLFWDVETRSAVSLETAGVSRYAVDPTTEIVCISYAVGNRDPQIWVSGNPVPKAFTTATKVVAHNFMFERAVLTHKLEPLGFPHIPLEKQVCTMTLALANALPGALENVAAALGLPLQKDLEGQRLMRKITQPLPRRKNDPPGLVRWYEPTPEELQRFHEYAKRDVAVTRLVYHALPPLSAAEQAHWQLDAVVNARGFCTDIALATAARDLARDERLRLNAEITALTGGEITSVDQVARIQAYVERQGHQLSSLNKRSVSAVLAHKPGEAVQRMLELRLEGARASVRKLDRLLAMVDADHRLRGSLRFHASSTGRWSGRGYQPQNLKKPEIKDIDTAVDAVLSGDITRVRELGAPLTIAGDIQRSVICAAAGHKLIAGDFSAIESRVLAWHTDEKWKLETYRKYDETNDPKLEPYCVLASQALKRAVTPNDDEGRQLGKTYDLAFGFGGGLGAWRKFDPSDTYTDAEVESFKQEFRHTHRATVRFWRALESAAHRAVRTGAPIKLNERVSFAMENGTLFMQLPSGRRLAYPEARLGPGKFEFTRELTFRDNAFGGWTDVSAWYGTLVENLVQATARDLLAAALQRVEAASYKIVLHIHDEIVCEVPENFGSEDEFRHLMLELPDWAAGLPIAGKVRSGQRYAKSNAKRTTQVEPVQPSVGFSGDAEVAAEVSERTSELPRGSPIGHNPLDGAEIAITAENKICCPFHADATPSCQLYADGHYHCFGCGAHGLISELGELEVCAPAPRKAMPAARALELWTEARPIAGTLAARYLANTRGIDLEALPANIDNVLRFHPRCPFGSVRHPCLLALMRGAVTDTPTGVQRIALTSKAEKIERRMLGHSGVVKLWPIGTQLVIGEGLETTLAAATRVPYRGALLQPAWAAVSADLLSKLPILDGVGRLIVLVDHDAAGQAAAACCAGRWTCAGRTVVKLTPKRTGADFNDLVPGYSS
jgi:Toprim domain/DNA polymerase family A/CHC2 zinc finger